MQDSLYKEFNEAIKKPPVDLEILCQKINIELVTVPMDDRISGMLEPKSNGEYKITVNSNMSNGRQRFTIAHELGHLALHRDLIGNGLDDRAMRSTTPGCYDNTLITRAHETEANQFAAALLMPKEAVLREALRLDKNILALANYFQVSESAMQIRLSSLLSN
ncbi:ImmA/IrrE family metallo-endopeptidase [Marinomonas algicola]|uniref:ImmA/IrrE family metallo-endopeptidase n=1 Tax=Marinomonas algicola TaxID=2773454 RepID=UPI001747FFA6|nr:ImmA/IrrE family metallo-endopeptidase [Marinomonas algicola]